MRLPRHPGALRPPKAGSTAPAAPPSSATTTSSSRALGKAALAAGAHLLGGVDVLHVHDWQGAPAAIYAHTSSGRGHFDRHDDPQPRVPRHLRQARAAGARASRGPCSRRRLLEFYRSALAPQGRARARRRGHHRQPDVRARDPDAGARRGARRLPALGREAAGRDRERHRRGGVEPGDRRGAPRAVLGAGSGRQARVPRGARRRGRAAAARTTRRRSSASSRGSRTTRAAI